MMKKGLFGGIFLSDVLAFSLLLDRGALIQPLRILMVAKG
jgi:hypothetical protein